MILDHIARARAAGLPHVYLGYWVNGSRKMNYKMRFHAAGASRPKGWERFTERSPESSPFTQMFQPARRWSRIVHCVSRPDTIRRCS